MPLSELAVRGLEGRPSRDRTACIAFNALCTDESPMSPTSPNGTLIASAFSRERLLLAGDRSESSFHFFLFVFEPLFVARRPAPTSVPSSVVQTVRFPVPWTKAFLSGTAHNTATSGCFAFFAVSRRYFWVCVSSRNLPDFANGLLLGYMG